MDVEMTAETPSIDGAKWDIKTENGIVPILSGEKEDLQIATLAAFLEYGTIPQLQEVGVEWTAFLTGDLSFGALDVQIRQALQKADKSTYRINYDITGDRLTVAVSSGGNK